MRHTELTKVRNRNKSRDFQKDGDYMSTTLYTKMLLSWN